MKLNKSIVMHKGDIYDPEPLTIALTFMGAIVSIGILLAERAFKKRDERRSRRDAIRNRLFDARRALNNMRYPLIEFSRLLRENGYLSRESETLTKRKGEIFRLGQASILGGSATTKEFKRLYSDTCQAGKDFNNAILSLSRLLNDEDFQTCIRYSERLNFDLRNAMRSENYKSYLVSMDSFLVKADKLIFWLGRSHGLMWHENSWEVKYPMPRKYGFIKRTKKG